MFLMYKKQGRLGEIGRLRDSASEFVAAWWFASNLPPETIWHLIGTEAVEPWPVVDPDIAHRRRQFDHAGFSKAR